ncbi:hypothetical protein [Nibricoccus sp. IMCC34717]|uniref:hypothetical protein n=1 Tax=Nibricoccus sp. IMCC34717 TaxID=3034021 RepID=UPI00384FD888
MSDGAVAKTRAKVSQLLADTRVQRGLSAAAGLLAALVILFFLYRVEVPSKPFIYVAF